MNEVVSATVLSS